MAPFDPEKTVSREHVKLTRTSEGFFVTDLGSTNGTLLAGGSPLQAGRPHKLRANEKFLVGSVCMHLAFLQLDDVAGPDAAAPASGAAGA